MMKTKSNRSIQGGEIFTQFRSILPSGRYSNCPFIGLAAAQTVVAPSMYAATPCLFIYEYPSAGNPMIGFGHADGLLHSRRRLYHAARSGPSLRIVIPDSKRSTIAVRLKPVEAWPLACVLPGSNFVALLMASVLPSP